MASLILWYYSFSILREQRTLAALAVIYGTFLGYTIIVAHL